MDRTHKKSHARLFLLQGALVLIFTALLYRLWELQIVNGTKYAEEFELKTTRIVKDGSLRGNIYDRNGELLAYNKLVYTVTMVDNGDYASNRERQLGLNGMIYKVIKKLEEEGEQLNNELKIMAGPDGGYEYVTDADGTLKEESIALNEDGIVPESRIELPEDVWHTVKAGMVQYAQNNSVLKDMEVSVAGKTGTAQESKCRPDHALFVGYAPQKRRKSSLPCGPQTVIHLPMRPPSGGISSMNILE